MILTEALTELLEYGRLGVDDSLEAFKRTDTDAAVNYLRQKHATDSLDMPYTAPAFNADAACWAASYVCRAAQIIQLRDLGEEDITKHLQNFTGHVTPEAVYAADLTLRHLPDLVRLARRIAPQDVLLTYLKRTASQWPFSSVGMTADPLTNLDVVLKHPSLTTAYADRIIATQDVSRLADPRIHAIVQTQLGSHTRIFWPDFENILNVR